MKKDIVSFLSIFGIIYDIGFEAIPILTSGRIAFFFLLITKFKDFKLVLKEYKFIKFIILLLLLVSFLQFSITNDNTQFSRFFFFTTYSLIGSLFIARRVNETRKLLMLIVSAVSFQSIILIIVFFNPNLRATLDQYIVYGGNFSSENLYRAFGLSSQTGAALSLTQSLGVGAGLLLLTYDKRNHLIKVSIIICFLSTLFVGRTGILISLLLFVAYLYHTISFKKVIKISFFIILSTFFISTITKKATASLDSINGFSSEFFIRWLKEGFEIENNKTFKALVSDQKIPELTIQNFFIGSGTITTSNGLNTSGHDSGYVQTYYSIGLILTILFYLSIYAFIILNFKIPGKRNLVLFISFIILALEFKEPMLFKYSEAFIFLAILFSLKYENKIITTYTTHI